jgi:hypothetical protein
MIFYEDLNRLNKPINNLLIEYITVCNVGKGNTEPVPSFLDYAKDKGGIDCQGYYFEHNGHITLTRCGIINVSKFIEFLLRYE